MPAPVTARTRLLISFLIGCAVLVPTLLFTSWEIAVLAGWDTVALVFILLVFRDVHHLDAAGTRARATREDNSRVVADAVLVTASVISLVGVAFALVKAAASQGAAHGLITALAVATVVASWASVHTIFTLRYARIYYRDGGGIDWHADDKPHYGDFAYVALTIGMTFQVSDTDLITKAIRMTALRHALLSYLFGVVVVAMTINVVASLLTK